MKYHFKNVLALILSTLVIKNRIQSTFYCPTIAGGRNVCVCVTYWHIGIRVKVQVHGVNIRLHSETENHLNYSSWPFSSSWEGTEMWKNPWKHAFLNIVFMIKNVLAKCTKRTNDAMFRLYLNLRIILILRAKSSHLTKKGYLILKFRFWIGLLVPWPMISYVW